MVYKTNRNAKRPVPGRLRKYIFIEIERGRDMMTSFDKYDVIRISVITLSERLEVQERFSM